MAVLAHRLIVKSQASLREVDPEQIVPRDPCVGAGGRGRGGRGDRAQRGSPDRHGALSRHLRLLFLGTALVVAAFSTGIEFLFFLIYLFAAICIGSWFYARRGLRDVRADYRVLNPRTHVGEVLQAIYRVENHDRLGKAMDRVLERVDPPAQPSRPRCRDPCAQARGSGWRR